MFGGNGAGGKQNRVSGSGIIILAVGNEEKRESDDESPAQIAIRLCVGREEAEKQASEPEGKAKWIHHQDLLADVCERWVGDVFAGRANVAHQFEKGPMVPDVPDQVGEEDQQRDGATGKKPGREQKLALRGEKESEKQCECEDRDGIFVFESQTSDGAKREPELRILRLDHPQNHVSASGPEQWLERIHRELMIDGPPHGRSCAEQCGESNTEALRAEFAGERGDEEDARSACERGPKNQRG